MLGGDKVNIVMLKIDIEEIDVLVRFFKDKRNDINILVFLNIKVGDNKFVKLLDVVIL